MTPCEYFLKWIVKPQTVGLDNLFILGIFIYA